MNEYCGKIINCAENKIALLITHTIAPINLHSSPKVLRSAPVHLTKTLFAITFPIKLNVTIGHAHFYGKLLMSPISIRRTKLCTKFEVFSSSSFGGIDAAMVDMTVIDL